MTALITMFDRWVQAASLGKVSGIVLLDLSAAFDLVDHNYLVKKLEIYGLDNDCLKWISSYLGNRYQAVWIDNVISEFLKCEIGVPQGSNLGPLFFLIFFNDLLYTLTSSVDSYADDTTLTSSGDSVEDIESKLNKDCERVCKWMKCNRLKLNPDKTHLLTMGTQRRLNNLPRPLSVRMDNIALMEEPSHFESILGVYVQSNLKWQKQVSSLKAKLAQRLNGLNQIKNICSLSVRKLIAEGSFNSVLAYCLPLFGGMEKHQLQELQILQNKAARLVCRVPPRYNRKEVFKKLNWFTVNQLICYYTLIMVFKVRQSKSPEYLANILCLNSRYGRIKTRKQTLTLASNSFTHRGVQLWNKLPSTVRNEERIGPFKRLLRQWIFNHIQAFPDEA